MCGYIMVTATRFMHCIASVFGLISIKIIESNEFIILSYQTVNKETNKRAFIVTVRFKGEGEVGLGFSEKFNVHRDIA